MTNFRKHYWRYIVCLLSSSVLALSSHAEEGRPSQNAVAVTATEAATAVAPIVDLKDVAPPPTAVQPLPSEKSIDESQAPSSQLEDSLKETHFSSPLPEANTAKKFTILGSEVIPGTATRLAWSPDAGISGLKIPTPVLVINGKYPGKTLCLTAAVHGDELNGIEIVRRVMYDIEPKKLHGQIIGIPIVNMQGFQRASRYLPDRRDLNRFFPGDPDGSSASRIAYSLFTEVIQRCDALVDLHTGSFRRTNLPHLRADMSHPDVARFSEGFDEIAVVHSAGNPGMLRVAALQHGITAVTLEVGESLRLQESQVKAGVVSINSLLEREKMYSRLFSWGDPEPVYYRSRWVRASRGGILLSKVKLGDSVDKGGVLGTVTDPITNEENTIYASVGGRIIGMAINQVVMPGFAAYHIGIRAPEGRVVSEEAKQATEGFGPDIGNENNIQLIDPE